MTGQNSHPNQATEEGVISVGSQEFEQLRHEAFEDPEQQERFHDVLVAGIARCAMSEDPALEKWRSTFPDAIIAAQEIIDSGYMRLSLGSIPVFEECARAGTMILNPPEQTEITDQRRAA